MYRWDIINKLIQKIHATKYLEIGIDNSDNFNRIVCDYKIGVDPNPHCYCNYHLTSDDFFAQNKETFDVIFIDGLHHADVVERDINNALKILNSGGYIVCHDMNPWDEEVQLVPRQTGNWTGDCWKAWVKIRSYNPNVNMFVIDTDCGCGVISVGNQELLKLECDLTYTSLVNNRTPWLNLIDISAFNKIISDS